MSEHVRLGDLVKDPITGFTGVMTGRTEFLHGCVRVAVTACNLHKDGQEHILHFDLAQLELVEENAFVPKRHNQSRPVGGPGREAHVSPRRNDDLRDLYPLETH